MKIKLFLIQVVVFLFAVNSYAQSGAIDSLNSILRGAKHDTTKARIYVALTEELAGINMDTVIPMCHKSLAIVDQNFEKANESERRSYLATKAYAHTNIGYIYNTKGDMTQALEHYQKALKIQEDLSAKYPGDKENKKALAYSYNNIGFVYDNHGDIQRALEYYHKSLKIQEEILDKKGMAYSFNNLGFIYNSQGDIPKALDYYNRSLKIRREIGDKQGIANSFNNLGSIYTKQALETKDIKLKPELFGKALNYFQESLKTQEELGNKRGIAFSYNNIGGVYNKQANETSRDTLYEEALEHYLKGLKIFKEINNKKGEAAILDNIGAMYMGIGSKENSPALKDKNYRLAEQYCLQSLQLSRELGFPENIKEAAKSLYLIYKYRKDGMKSLEYHELYTLMKDSISNVETQKAGVKKQMQYEFDKKEAILKEEQVRQAVVSEEKSKRQRLFILLVGCVAIAVAVIAILVFRSLKITRRQKEIIEKQKHLVEEKQNEILSSIRYAKRIQTALLPNEKLVQKLLKSYNKD